MISSFFSRFLSFIVRGSVTKGSEGADEGSTLALQSGAVYKLCRLGRRGGAQSDEEDVNRK